MCRGGSGVARGGRGGATRPGAELVRWPWRARCFGLSGLRGAPHGRFSPKSPRRPAQAEPSFRRSSPAPRRISKGPSARAERLCGPSAAWHLADAPLAAGGGGGLASLLGAPRAGPLPPLVQPPRAASALGPGRPPPVPPARPPRHAPGPPLSPARRRAPSGMGCLDA